MDQMIGASGEELRFAIYRIVWGDVVGWCLAISVNSIRIHSELVALTISSVSFLASYFLFHCFSHHFNTNARLNNLIKLIFQVLNYIYMPLRTSSLSDEAPLHIGRKTTLRAWI